MEAVGSGVAHLSHFTQTLLAHEREVDGHVEGHEALVGTDVGRGFLTTDVLFTRLKCQHESTLSAVVEGLTHDSSRQFSHQFLGASHETYAGTAEGHRNTEALTFAHGDISAPFGGRLQDGEVVGVGVDDKDAFLLVHGIGDACIVLNDTEIVGLLHDDTGNAAFSQLFVKCLSVESTILGRNELDGEAVEVGIGIDHAAHLRINGLSNQHASSLLGIAPRHHGSLGCGGGTVVHRSVRDVHTREFRNHGLILKDIVQRALRDLSLIRCVGGQELRALNDVLHHAGGVVIVAPGTGEADELLRIQRMRQLFEEEAQVGLGQCLRQVVVALETGSLRHVSEEVVNTLHSRHLQHLLQILLGMREILKHTSSFLQRIIRIKRIIHIL